jgi:hypothetical protein
MSVQYGEEQVGYVVAESTFGTAVVPAATDAFRVTSFDITPGFDRPEVPETTNTRSLQERIAGRRSCTFSITMVNRPSGTAGTPPDYHLLLKHAFGTYTNTSSTKDVYTPLKDPSGLSLSGYRLLEGVLEGFYGGVVTDVTFGWSADDFATVTFNGEAKDMLWAGVSQTNGTGSSATALIVDDGSYYSKYGVIDIANAGTAKQITAISSETLTIASSSWSDNVAIEPFLPAPTLAGSGLYGTDGTLSLDGGSSDISSLNGSVTLSTGISLNNRNFGTATADSVTLPSGRRVTGSLSFLVEDNGNFSAIRGEASEGTTQDIVVDIGTSAGSICQLDMSRCELDSSPLSGGAGLIEVTAGFTALAATTTGKENEITLTYK